MWEKHTFEVLKKKWKGDEARHAMAKARDQAVDAVLDRVDDEHLADVLRQFLRRDEVLDELKKELDPWGTQSADVQSLMQLCEQDLQVGVFPVDMKTFLADWIQVFVLATGEQEKLLPFIQARKIGPAHASSAAPPQLPPIPVHTPSDGDLKISLSHLPNTSDLFVGRTDELARLDAAWNGDTRVLCFVAIGGAGKTSLVGHWLDQMSANGWRGAQRVFGWSFYSQGTEATGASGDLFLDRALRWFGQEGELPRSARDKGALLAELVHEKKTLLVLDGLEPLQYSNERQGRLKDPGVQALIKELAVHNPGLLVITTRVTVESLGKRPRVDMVDLERLSPDDGVELLRALRVKGPESELRDAVKELEGHGLALTLLGTYLRDATTDHEIRRRHEIPLIQGDTNAGQHARKVMQAYAEWLSETDRAVLRLLGLFDRPAEAGAIQALRSKTIPGLNDGLLDDAPWNLALNRLREARLLLSAETEDGGLDAHPLVREYFGERLLEQSEEAWRAGHSLLFEYYRGNTEFKEVEELPPTVEGLGPLFVAVVHGCRAGRTLEAYEEVFQERIYRRSEFFSQRQLGIFGLSLQPIAAMFTKPWHQPFPELPKGEQAWLLNEAGFVLRALGRLEEAVQPMDAGLKAFIDRGEWKDAAITATNLSELTLTLGRLDESAAWAQESVELADRSGDEFWKMASRTRLATTLHQQGNWEESLSRFEQAEDLQKKAQPQYPRLYSLPGYQYCDLLLDRAADPHPPTPSPASGRGGAEPEPTSGSPLPPGRGAGGEGAAAYEQIRKRAEETLDWVRPQGWVLDIALDNLTLGRTHLGLALCSKGSETHFQSAAEHLEQAVRGLRQAGQESYLSLGLIARATYHRHIESPEKALADLEEALDIADRGSMLLHHADAHLELARLHLSTGNLEKARESYEEAKSTVDKTGYERRRSELDALASALD